MTAGEFLSLARPQLAGVDIPAPLHEARLLACHVLGCDSESLIKHPDTELTPDQKEQLESLLQKRLERYPLQYLLGEWEFFGRSFAVSSAVLVPRPETELLVERALAYGGAGRRILDVGTGSGCIAVTLACEQPDWQVAACDISPAALGVAASNSERLAQGRVELVRADAEFLPFAANRFDLVLSNPPYAAPGDRRLDPEVLHEPRRAVFGGEDGLSVIRLLLSSCLRLLQSKGLLLMEIGEGQAEAVGGLAVSAGWAVMEQLPDLAGIERCLVLSPQR